MSSQKITDYKILQVITKKSKVNEKTHKKGNSNNPSYVPMRSVKLIPPQQPQDNQQNDVTIIPEEVNPIMLSVERNQALICDLKQEIGFSTYNTKLLKKTNTDINFNDLSLYFLQSMKLFRQDKNSKNLGKLTKKLLQDKNNGNYINFPSSLSKNVNILNCFTYIFYINNISILLLNSMFCLFKNNFDALFVELLQLLVLSINCIYNWQKYRKDIYDKLQINKQQYFHNIIIIFFQIILIVLLILIMQFSVQQQYLIICLILLNIITIEQLSQIKYMWIQESLIKLILLAFQQCYLFSCVYLILFNENFILLNFDEQLNLYFTIYLRFFGYLVGIDLQLQNIESDIEITVFILYTWITMLIIKYQFLIQLYLLVQMQKTVFKDKKNMIDFINILKSLNIGNSKLKKLFNQIQQQYAQQKEIARIKNVNFLINFYGIKDSLRQQIINQDKMKHLKFVNLFNKLSRQSLNNLINLIEIQYFKNEEMIISQDKLDDCSIYIIKSGQVEISFKNSQNSLVGIKVLGVHECFGQIAFLTGTPRCASVRSIGESCIYKLERTNFLQIIQNNNDDKELINVIKNEIIFQNEYEILGIKCYNCSCSGHLIQNCPQLHLLVQKEQVILDFLAPSDQKRHKFKRRDAQSANTRYNALNTQVKCQEFQEDQGYVSSLGETDHTNYQQNLSHYTITQSSINYPSKIFGQKLSLRPSTIDNLQGVDVQESLKEQQFREIDQIFIRASNPKATTSTAGFGYKEQCSQKSPQTENVNNTIDEQASEDSSIQSSSFSDDQVSKTSRQTGDQKLRQMKQSNNRSEKYSQHRSGVSSISMNNTPKQHSQLSILNTFTLKSDINNNVQLSGGTNHGSQKLISPLHLREKEDRQNTLTIPGGNNMLQVPSKRSLINPISQLNYEMSPFVAFPQHHPVIINELQWSPIDIDRHQIFQTYYPKFNVDIVIQNYHTMVKNNKDNIKRLKSNINELFKYNTF